MRSRPLRWPLTVALALALALLALAAALADRPDAAPPVIWDEVPAEGGVYAEAVVGQPLYLNPLLAAPNSPDQDVVALAFSGLTRVAPTGEVVPDLAQDWEVSPDGLSYTFRLRPGLTWQDGQPLDADDVVFTYRAIQAPDYRGPPALAALWRGALVEKLDDLRVRLTYPAPVAPALEYASLGIVPAHVLAGVPAASLPAHAFNARPVGSGPYQVVAADSRAVALEASPRYAGRRPYLARIELHYYPTAGEALAALQLGAVQGVAGLTAEAGASLASGDAASRLALYPYPERASLTALVLNLRQPPFDDAAVRQALAYAVDRARVAGAARGAGATPASGPVPPDAPGYDAGAWAYDYQPDRARALLDGAGWLAAPGEPVRQRGHQRLEFALLTNDDPERIRAAEELSRELARVGVGATVQAAGWTGVVQDFLAPHRFQAALVGLWSPTVDPDPYAFWHSSQAGAGLNFGGWASPAADDLLGRARAEPRPAERAALYRRFQAVFAEAAPALPLYYPVSTYAVARSVRGVRVGVVRSPADRLAGVADWYLRTRRVPRGY